MADFEKSFNIGISSAEKAEKNRAEITGVFDDLNRQLRWPSGGKLQISRAQLYESINPFRVSIFEKKPTYQAIIATNPKADDNSHKELAKWKQDRSGYPCVISFGDRELYCDDKEALEDALSQLLQDPIVGDALHGLMSRRMAGNKDEGSQESDD